MSMGGIMSESDHIGRIGYVTEYGSTITAKKKTKTGHWNVTMFDTSEYRISTYDSRREQIRVKLFIPFLCVHLYYGQ